jgi:hypothetical protein
MSPVSQRSLHVTVLDSTKQICLSLCETYRLCTAWAFDIAGNLATTQVSSATMIDNSVSPWWEIFKLHFTGRRPTWTHGSVGSSFVFAYITKELKALQETVFFISATKIDLLRWLKGNRREIGIQQCTKDSTTSLFSIRCLVPPKLVSFLEIYLKCFLLCSYHLLHLFHVLFCISGFNCRFQLTKTDIQGM